MYSSNHSSSHLPMGGFSLEAIAIDARKRELLEARFIDRSNHPSQQVSQSSVGKISTQLGTCLYQSD